MGDVSAGYLSISGSQENYIVITVASREPEALQTSLISFHNYAATCARKQCELEKGMKSTRALHRI